MNLEDLLHDEVDALEELRDKANRIVMDTVKEHLDDLLTKTTSSRELLTALSILVENKLATLTTEAVNEGARLAEKRAKELGS